MLAIIQDNHYLYLDQVTSGIEECLVDWFSIQDPRAHFISSPWDGWYRRYNTAKQRLSLSFIKELVKCCEHHNIPLEIEDRRSAPTFPAPNEDQITEDLLSGIRLEQYQVEALKTCCHEEIGIISSPVGSGKTEIICGLVKMFRCPTVIITEQIVVLEQIVERLTMRQVVHNNDIGMFCHGHMPDGNLVVVGSIQSLSSPKKPEKSKIKITQKQVLRYVSQWIKTDSQNLYHAMPKTLADALIKNPDGISELRGAYLQMLVDYCREIEWVKRVKAYKTRLEHAGNIQSFVQQCDLLIVDEVDLAVGSQYSTLFRGIFKGRRRYGLSGTPFDAKKPVNALLLKENIGNIICETDRKLVLSLGRSVPVKCYMFIIGENGDRNDRRAYDIAIKEEMVENNEFHQSVARIVSSFPNDGTLILVDTSPIEPLGLALENIIPNSKFIYGGTPRVARRKYIELFEARSLKCLIGSKILRRGLDLHGGVENLIIIGGGGKWSDFDQKVGRAVRVNKRGWSRVFGFFFLNNKYLYKHSRENLKAIISMGYPAKVITNGIEIDGEKFIRSRFSLRTGNIRTQRNITEESLF